MLTPLSNIAFGLVTAQSSVRTVHNVMQYLEGNHIHRAYFKLPMRDRLILCMLNVFGLPRMLTEPVVHCSWPMQPSHRGSPHTVAGSSVICTAGRQGQRLNRAVASASGLYTASLLLLMSKVDDKANLRCLPTLRFLHQI